MLVVKKPLAFMLVSVDTKMGSLVAWRKVMESLVIFKISIIVVETILS